MGIHFDTSEVEGLIVDLRGAPDRMQRKAPKVLEVGANKVKRNMKRIARGHDYLPELDRFVSYTKYGRLNYEIGFDKIGQGNLANFAAYGSINNAPVMDHTLALREEIPSIMSNLADAGEKEVLRGDA